MPKTPGTHEFFPIEVEEEFVSAMVWAAHLAGEAETEQARIEYESRFSAGLEIDPTDLSPGPIRAAYDATLALLGRGDFPTWGMLKDYLRRHNSGDRAVLNVHLLVSAPGLTGAIPTYVRRIKEAAETRRQEQSR